MADEGTTQGSKRVTTLLTTVGGAVGVLVSVAALNVDRSWRIGALAIGLLGFVVVLAATRLRHATGAVQAGGITLLVVAGLVLVVSPAPSTPKPPQPKAQLSVSQLLVTGGTNLFEPVKLDITVHNLGDRLAVLTGLRIKILDFAYMRDCYTQGEIGASKPYPVSLPDNPAAGTVMTVPLHEEVGHRPGRPLCRAVAASAIPGKQVREHGGRDLRVPGGANPLVRRTEGPGSRIGGVRRPVHTWVVELRVEHDRPRPSSYVREEAEQRPANGLERSVLAQRRDRLDKNSSALARLLHPEGARSDEMAQLLSAIEPN